MSSNIEPLQSSPTAADELAIGIRRHIHPHSGAHGGSVWLFSPRALTYRVRWQDEAPSVIMYGTDPSGTELCVRATGFHPYLFVRFPSDEFDDSVFARVLETHLRRALVLHNRHSAETKALCERDQRMVISVKHETAYPVKGMGAERGFVENPHQFRKVTLFSPRLVRIVRRIFEGTIDEEDNSFDNLAAEQQRRDHKKGRDGVAEKLRTLLDCKQIERIEEHIDAPNELEADLVDHQISAALDATVDPEADHTPTVSWRERDLPDNFASVCAIYRDEKTTLFDATFEAYEADLDFTLRFCIDHKFKPEEWLELRQFEEVEDDGYRKLSVCPFELKIHHDDLVRCADADMQDTLIAPQLLASFDMETEVGPNGAFPRASEQKILQIAVVVNDPIADGDCERLAEVLFALGPLQRRVVENRRVLCFGDESTMLRAFSSFIKTLMPTVLTGYNIDGFDLPFLLDRAKTLGCHEQVARFSRSQRKKVRVREKTSFSSGSGFHRFKESIAEGLFIFDLFAHFKRDALLRLRSYKLNAVAAHFLDRTKDDVSYSQINGLQLFPAGRLKLGEYCLTDARLPLQMICKRLIITNTVELCRVTGVTIEMIARRGQQIRGKTELYDEAQHSTDGRYLVYTRTDADRHRDRGIHYAGGEVLRPDVGLHERPVCTLDFKSLYPTIIVSRRICPSLKLYPGRTVGMPSAEHIRLMPVGHFDMTTRRFSEHLDSTVNPSFVKPSLRRGLFPAMEEKLLERRSRAKKDKSAAFAAAERHRELAEAAKQLNDFATAARELEEARKQQQRGQIMDGRQLALKLCANSLYGILGAETSFLYDPECAAAVTGSGRDLILHTLSMVEERFQPTNGYPFISRVIYGDTDSIFARCDPVEGQPPLDVQTSACFAFEMAQFVTDKFRELYAGPTDGTWIIELEFEKTYSKIILYAKKRYVGMKYEWSKKFSRMVTTGKPSAKGMENVRRDSCLMVNNAVNDIIMELMREGVGHAVSLQAVRRYVLDRIITPLQDGTINFWLLIQSKQFRRPAAAYRTRDINGRMKSPPIHVVLVEKMEQRYGADNDNVPRPGDRVSYVVVESPNYSRTKTSQCGEEPLFAWRKALRPNRQHYLDNAILKMLARVLAPMLLSQTEQDELAAEDVSRSRADRVRLARVRTFLFRGQTPRLGAGRVVTAQQGLGRFFGQQQFRCNLCNQPMPPSAKRAYWCLDCARSPKAERRLGSLLAQQSELDARRAAIWHTCQSCMGTEGDEITCENQSCEVLWDRLGNVRQREKTAEILEMIEW